MELVLSLTMAKNKNDGITRYISEIYKRLMLRVPMTGISYIAINDSKSIVRELYSELFPSLKVEIKKMPLPMRVIASVANGKIHLPSFLNKCKPNQIYVYFYNFIPRKKSKCKNILVIHDLTPLHQDLNSKERKKLIDRYKNSCENASLIFTDSFYSKNDICKELGIDESKVVVNYCGVSKSKFDVKYTDNELSEIRNKYNVNKNYVLFVGQARDNKNLENLVLGYAKIPTGIRKNYNLVLANSNQKIHTLIVDNNLENDVIELAGVADHDLPALYKMARAVALVSISEGFGLPLIESMICGVPTVTSNVSCMPEVSSGASILVNPYDVGSIADGLTEIITNDETRNNCINRGYEVVKNYNWDKTADIFFESIKELLNGRK